MQLNLTYKEVSLFPHQKGMNKKNKGSPLLVKKKKSFFLPGAHLNMYTLEKGKKQKNTSSVVKLSQHLSSVFKKCWKNVCAQQDLLHFFFLLPNNKIKNLRPQASYQVIKLYFYPVIIPTMNSLYKNTKVWSYFFLIFFVRP